MSASLVNITSEYDNMRLDRYLQSHYEDISFVQVQKKCRKGEVRVNSKRVKSSYRLVVGDIVRIPPFFKEKACALDSGDDVYSVRDAEYIQNMVIYENDGIVVINKDSGLATQGGTGVQRSVDSLSRYLNDNDTIRLVHRLDKGTSGVLVLAKSRQVSNNLRDKFKERSIKKKYVAIVHGTMEKPAGVINQPLLKQNSGDFEKVVVDEELGKEAITKYKVLSTYKDELSVVALWPETGRTHQLRVHLAYLGHPILGDTKYGSKVQILDSVVQVKKMCLHAETINIPEMDCSQSVVKISADLPQHMLDVLAFFDLEVSV